MIRVSTKGASPFTTITHQGTYKSPLSLATLFVSCGAVEVQFDKMHGCGNDFVILDGLAVGRRYELTSAQIRAIADRRRGIGFDQLIVIDQPADPNRIMAANSGKLVANYRIFNADGSSAEQCGNGARTLWRMGHQRGQLGTCLCTADRMVEA